jgi:hypothetical protein
MLLRSFQVNTFVPQGNPLFVRFHAYYLSLVHSQGYD